MFKFLTPLLLPLAFLGTVPAQEKPPPAVHAATDEPELIGAATFDYLAEFKVKNAPAGTAIIWDVFPNDSKTVTRTIKSEKACLIAGPAREYSVTVRLVKGEDVVTFKKSFTITGGGPRPPPPTPDPPPIPDPPAPSVAPIPDPGFRVMIVYQDKDKNKYSASQRALLYGQEIRDYMRTKAAVGADGMTAEIRIWDVDVKGIENEAKLWQTAWARPHPTVALVADPANPMLKREIPVVWLLVSNGKAGWEGPILPTMSTADIMAILKKYGGG